MRDALLTPIWSPGRNDEIALVGDSFSRKLPGVSLVRPDGRGLRRLIRDPTTNAHWVPNGSHIAASTKGDVWIVDRAGGTPVRLTDGERNGYLNGEIRQWLPRVLPAARLPGTPIDAAVPSDKVVEGRILKTRRPADSPRAELPFG